MPTKPETKADLTPPFTRIGEPGWDAALRQLFDAYELPLTPPVPPHDLAAVEDRLGIHLPDAVTHFFTTFGAVDFDGIRLLDLHDITSMQSVWCAPMLSPADRARLSRLLQIAAVDSDDYYALDLDDWSVYHITHDPPGMTVLVPSFDDVIRLACIDLSWGYYGWPDEDVEAMAHELKRDLFGF